MTEGVDVSGWPEWQSFVERHGYLSWLDITAKRVADGEAVLTIERDDEFENPLDTEGLNPVHGGIVATLIDTSSAFALRSTFEDPENGFLTTTDLNVSYLRPATGDLRAEATVLRAGGTTGVTDVSVVGDSGEVAVGRTTYRLFRETDGDADGD